MLFLEAKLSLTNGSKQLKNGFGETPNPTRGTRALPKPSHKRSRKLLPKVSKMCAPSSFRKLAGVG
jgi:hypothetical protein